MAETGFRVESGFSPSDSRENFPFESNMDPELLKEMRTLAREIRSNEAKIGRLKHNIRLWKMRLEPKLNVGRKRDAGRKKRSDFAPRKM